MGNFTFNNVPVIRHSRSRFDLSHSVKTSANVGTLYPFDVQEVYAGDTFKVKTAVVSRLTSQFLRPVMDNLFLDVYYFFVPSRLLYSNYVNIFGENTESAWANTQDYEVPSVSASSIPSGSVGDYMGLPLLGGDNVVSVLPFRAFAKIYNEWFRDQNNVPPMHIQQGEANGENLNGNAWSPSNYTGMPPKVAKFHDYFTSALPAPQKGSAVDLPIVSSGNVLPVVTSNVINSSNYGLAFSKVNDTGFPNNASILSRVGLYSYAGPGGNPSSATLSVSQTTDSLVGAPDQIYPSNLVADTSSLTFDPVSVNDLRFAFQYQKMLERDARSGSRFTEYLQAHFGVSAGDARLQRSEFLGGRRSPISITQVTQTTGSGSDSSPLGEVGAYSWSNAKSRYTKGFVEPGYVIGVFCIRQFHSYQQGIERFWSRFKRIDFFDPVYSHIGEQPIYRRELYANETGQSSTVFGYNEAWADLRYRPNRVTGQMRSGISNSLDVWHFADDYSSAPVLSQSFIEETPNYVNRAITVESSSQDQFILDFYIQNIAYRPLPTYSVPSLIDHD